MLLALVTLSFSTLLLPSLSEAYDSRCPTGLPGVVTVYGEKCYQFQNHYVRWNTAKEHCRIKGGQLIQIRSDGVQRFVINKLNALSWPNRGTWIGLHDRHSEGHFVWDTNPGPDIPRGPYTYWQRGEPDDHRQIFFSQDCVYMRRSYGYRWVDVDCDSIRRTYYYICEYRMTPTTTAAATTTLAPTTPRPTTVTTTPTPTTSQPLLRPAVISTGPPTPAPTPSTESPLVPLVRPGGSGLAQVGEAGEHTFGSGGIIGVSVTGVLCLILLLVLILVVVRRRRQKPDDFSVMYRNESPENPAQGVVAGAAVGMATGGAEADLRLKTGRHVLKEAEAAETAGSLAVCSSNRADSNLYISIDELSGLGAASRRDLPPSYTDLYEDIDLKTESKLDMAGDISSSDSEDEKEVARYASPVAYRPRSSMSPSAEPSSSSITTGADGASAANATDGDDSLYLQPVSHLGSSQS